MAPNVEFILVAADGSFFRKLVPSGFYPEQFSATRYVKRPSAKTIRTIEEYYGVKVTVKEVPA